MMHFWQRQCFSVLLSSAGSSPRAVASASRGPVTPAKGGGKGRERDSNVDVVLDEACKLKQTLQLRNVPESGAHKHPRERPGLGSDAGASRTRPGNSTQEA